MKTKKVSQLPKDFQVRALVNAVEPLLALFAVVDTICTEDDLFDPDVEGLRKSIGRIYREWLKARAALDPEFNPKAFREEHRQRARRGR